MIASCSDSKSYAERLEQEDQASNRFLADQRVIGRVPEDSVFEVGPNAPYYCLNPEDKTVYMQVLNVGDKDRVPEKARVYFRYTRFNLFSYQGPQTNTTGSGNADNMSMAASYFIFKDMANSNSSEYGEGIQMPLNYFGYNCTVRLLIKSQMGVASEQIAVTPMLYTVTYFKSQI